MLSEEEVMLKRKQGKETANSANELTDGRLCGREKVRDAMAN